MPRTKLKQEGCSVQHIPTGQPSTEWTTEELSAYARAKHEAIRDSERLLAVNYWRLGQALNLLRRNFNSGQWERMLGDLKIHKSKASRARSIAKTFDKEEMLAGLTVNEAYAKRARSPQASKGGRKKSPEKDKQGKLMSFLQHVSETGELLIDEAGFAEEAEVATILAAADEAVAKLDKIRCLLRERVPQVTSSNETVAVMLNSGKKPGI
jgi:hypothetical protein